MPRWTIIEFPPNDDPLSAERMSRLRRNARLPWGLTARSELVAERMFFAGTGLSLQMEARRRTAMWLELTKLALMLQDFRHRHGEFPEHLEQLVPAWISRTPTDAFSDEPLIYRRTKHGCIAYSVGSDREDNGGAELGEEGEDIVVRLKTHH